MHENRFYNIKYLVLRNEVTSALVNPNKIEVFVDDIPVHCDPGMTVLQACAIAGVEIPRFSILMIFIISLKQILLSRTSVNCGKLSNVLSRSGKKPETGC